MSRNFDEHFAELASELKYLVENEPAYSDESECSDVDTSSHTSASSSNNAYIVAMENTWRDSLHLLRIDLSDYIEDFKIAPASSTNHSKLTRCRLLLASVWRHLQSDQRILNLYVEICQGWLRCCSQKLLSADDVVTLKLIVDQIEEIVSGSSSACSAASVVEGSNMQMCAEFLLDFIEPLFNVIEPLIVSSAELRTEFKEQRDMVERIVTLNTVRPKDVKPTKQGKFLKSGVALFKGVHEHSAATMYQCGDEYGVATPGGATKLGVWGRKIEIHEGPVGLSLPGSRG
ncbi:MAG: hypothetical protein COB66_07245 [Coxiella sp. (in: Bacteria)]|nr:MAG: hypothetical protein COB66_07245 [Coxiella sp. (in: g-proteobacteria)]